MQLGYYLICIQGQRGIHGNELYAALHNGFYHQPNIRLPFDVLALWIQLEIKHKNFEFISEVLIKPYIA